MANCLGHVPRAMPDLAQGLGTHTRVISENRQSGRRGNFCESNVGLPLGPPSPRSDLVFFLNLFRIVQASCPYLQIPSYPYFPAQAVQNTEPRSSAIFLGVTLGLFRSSICTMRDPQMFLHKHVDTVKEHIVLSA
jgi:hypothetical protein